MRDRKKQRALRKAGIQKEERISLWNQSGCKDPTAYAALNHMVLERRGYRR